MNKYSSIHTIFSLFGKNTEKKCNKRKRVNEEHKVTKARLKKQKLLIAKLQNKINEKEMALETAAKQLQNLRKNSGEEIQKVNEKNDNLRLELEELKNKVYVDNFGNFIASDSEEIERVPKPTATRSESIATGPTASCFEVPKKA